MAQTTPGLVVGKRNGVTYHATSAGTHTVAKFAPLEDTAYHLRLRAVAQATTDTSKVLSGELVYTIYNNGGTIGVVPSGTTVHAKTGFTGGPSSVSATTSGAYVIVQFLTQMNAIIRVQADLLAIGGTTAPHEFGQPDNE